MRVIEPQKSPRKPDLDTSSIDDSVDQFVNGDRQPGVAASNYSQDDSIYAPSGLGESSPAPQKHHRLVWFKLFFALLVIAGILGYAYYILFADRGDVSPDTSATNEGDVSIESSFKSSPDKYRYAYSSALIEDSAIISTAPGFSGDTGFDRRVSELALARGYELRRVYAGDSLSNYRGHLLSENLKDPLDKMISAAKNDGLDLSISSGHRGLREQAEIFISRYQSALASGLSQTDAINGVLETAAPPGYSKHHSAYTVDMTCDGLGAEEFIDTECDKWLSADDYANAKKFGFIPSYPKGVEIQGPNPEPWEFNYVGAEYIMSLGL